MSETKNRYFLLDRMIRPGYFEQIGVVVASSVPEAVAKIKMHVLEVIEPPISKVVLVRLEYDYFLSEILDIGL